MSTAPSCPSSTSAKPRTRRPKATPAALAVAAALALGLPARSLHAAVVEEIVAKVNNRVITESEYAERQKALVAQIAQEHQGGDMDEELRQAQDTLLANVITEALLLERATNVFDMERIRGSLVDDFRKQQNIASDTELEQALKEQGM